MADQASTFSTGKLYLELARRAVITGGLHALALEAQQLLSAQEVRTIGTRDHRGAPAIKVDVEMDDVMRACIRSLDPSVVYLSEESATGANIVPFKTFFHCDPLDGTSNLKRIGTAWAVAGYFSRVRRDGASLGHLAGAIFASSGHVIAWAASRRRGIVRIDFPPVPAYGLSELLPVAGMENVVEAAREPRTLWIERAVDDSPSSLLNGGNARVLATVAAPGDRRKRLGELFDIDDPDLWIATVGGNPIIVPLLLGELGGAIETETVTLHDALFLIPLKAAGGVVLNLDGNPLDVFDPFEELEESQRVINGYVATVNRANARQILGLRRLSVS